MGTKGPPLPRPKCKPRNKDVAYLEESYKRDITKLESKVLAMSRNLHDRVRAYAANPTSDLHENLLESAYYSLDEATVDLISFEEANK